MPKLILSFALLAACADKGSVEPDTSEPSGGDGRCETTLYYQTTNEPDGVYLAGDFNNWDPDEYPMESWGDGEWAVTIELEPGAYAYQFIEFTQFYS